MVHMVLIFLPTWIRYVDKDFAHSDALSQDPEYMYDIYKFDIVFCKHTIYYFSDAGNCSKIFVYVLSTYR
jgi:hypothetical protein